MPKPPCFLAVYFSAIHSLFIPTRAIIDFDSDVIKFSFIISSPQWPSKQDIAPEPAPNAYDFSFLSPCPTSGLMIYGKKDELVPVEFINELNKKLSSQKGINVEFQVIAEANHFFSNSENSLIKNLNNCERTTNIRSDNIRLNSAISEKVSIKILCILPIHHHQG